MPVSKLEFAQHQLEKAGWDGHSPALAVLGSNQQLHCLGADAPGPWPVSTGAAGFGNRMGSNKTPTGLHQIKAKIGDGAPLGMVFRGRSATGEICLQALPGHDVITSRILWLAGLEDGVNSGGSVDSAERYIYIHGTPDEEQLGSEVSAGCVRLGNRPVRTLFEWVRVGTMVIILS